MAGTINIVGTGGIIEGNLGSANVNVNLDPIYGNFNADTSSSLSNDNDFDDMWAGNGGLFSAWIYPKSDGEGNFGRIADKNQWLFYVRDELNGFVRLNFNHSFSTTEGSWKTTDRVVPVNAWSHVAVFFDSDSASNDPVIYLNGVAQTLTEGTTPAGTRSSDASSDLYIGNNSSGTRGFDGYMMDIKIYKNTAWTQPEIAVLASKINVDKDHPSLPASGPRLYLWWKAIADATTDSSGSGNNLTASNMGSVVYDEFHVDVYAGAFDSFSATTTTDGTFTVTQGKVEGLALTSLAFDGTDDHVDLASSFTLSHDGSSIAFWVKKDNATGNQDTIIGQASDANQHWIKISTNGEVVLRDYPNDLGTSSQLADTNWNHVVITMSGDSNGAIYFNGVSQPLANNDVVGDPIFDHFGSRGTTDPFDGKLRDVKVFDYALSAEQAASLYSGTYVQTPKHHWKLDEGTGTAVEDYGTGTDSDGTIDGATYSNGTLDLDGAHSLTIQANGTLSAPRGSLLVAGDFQYADGANFTHNNGEVEFNGADPDLEMEGVHSGRKTPTNPLTFHKLRVSTVTNYLNVYVDFTVENTWTITNDAIYGIAVRQPAFITIGTSSSSGTITGPTSGQGNIYFAGAASGSKVLAPSSVYPWIYTGNDWGWSASNGNTILLENGDYQTALVTDEGYYNQDTGSNNITIQLTGDMEFDAVTVSSGDTLDLNGQRAVVSGVLSGSGAMNANNSTLIFTGTSGTVFDGGEGPDLSVTDSTDCTFICDAGSGSQVWKNRFQSSDATIFVQSGSLSLSYWNWEDITNFFVGGTFDNSSANRNVTTDNLTIPTGGTLSAGSGTLTCAGDFTTSGGLIGKSALDFDGSNDNVNCGNDSSLSLTNNFTLEAWIKPDTVSGEQTIISRGVTDNASSQYTFKLNSQQLRLTKEGVGNFDSGTNVITTTGKHYHVAVTVSSSDGIKFYVDGKLVGTDTNTSNCNSSSGNLFLGSRWNSSEYFNGVINMARIFSDVRTESELRADMFNAHANMANTGNLVGMWQFDEGTGSTVDNIQGTAANDGTISGASFVGAGTFTYGTSTLVMAKSGTQTINIPHNYNIGALTINDGSTTQLHTIDQTNGLIDIYGNLTINEKFKAHADSSSARVRMREATTITIGSDVKTTALAEMGQFMFDLSGSINVPELTTKVITMSNGTVVATGDLTLTEELEVNSGTTFNANTNTIAAKAVDLNAGTLDLRNSTLNFSVTSSGDSMDLRGGGTLLTGNTNINGNSSANRTLLYAPASGNWEVVGNVTNMNMNTDSDLTVIGSVTNCSATNSGSNIRQFFHTLDTQQLLDADEAGDDDLKLEKPALDNALELQTG